MAESDWDNSFVNMKRQNSLNKVSDYLARLIAILISEIGYHIYRSTGTNCEIYEIFQIYSLVMIKL